MSRIFKSNHVQIGAPKAVTNTFDKIIKNPKMKVDENNLLRVETETLDTADEENVLDREQEEQQAIAENIIDEAKDMYLKIMEEANSEARRIMEEAREEAEKLMNSSYESAFHEGYQQGYNEGVSKAQEIVEEAEAIKGFLDERRESLYKESENEIIELVLEISQKVIGDELAQNKDAIFSLVAQALKKCAFKNKLILRVSPADYQYVSDNKERIFRLVEGLSELEVYSDLTLSQGGCIIETPSGEINSSVDIQMKELEKIFLYMLRNE